jgi:hypothetical protein
MTYDNFKKSKAFKVNEKLKFGHQNFEEAGI